MLAFVLFTTAESYPRIQNFSDSEIRLVFFKMKIEAKKLRPKIEANVHRLVVNCQEQLPKESQIRPENPGSKVLNLFFHPTTFKYSWK